MVENLLCCSENQSPIFRHRCACIENDLWLLVWWKKRQSPQSGTCFGNGKDAEVKRVNWSLNYCLWVASSKRHLIFWWSCCYIFIADAASELEQSHNLRCMFGPFQLQQYWCRCFYSYRCRYQCLPVYMHSPYINLHPTLNLTSISGPWSCLSWVHVYMNSKHDKAFRVFKKNVK